MRQVRAKARKPVLPVLVKGSSSSEFLDNIRLLLYAMNPKRGKGALKVYTADGKTRILPCYMADAPIKESRETGIYTADKGAQWRMFPVTFYVPYPFYWDPTENDVYVDDTALEYPFALYNAGDIDAWPIWSITGANSCEIVNKTTNKRIYADLTLDTECLYIDTRPLLRSALIDHTDIADPYLSTDSKWFALVPGYNKIHVTDPTSVTSVRIRWVNNYLGV